MTKLTKIAIASIAVGTSSGMALIDLNFDSFTLIQGTAVNKLGTNNAARAAAGSPVEVHFFDTTNDIRMEVIAFSATNAQFHELGLLDLSSVFTGGTTEVHYELVNTDLAAEASGTVNFTFFNDSTNTAFNLTDEASVTNTDIDFFNGRREFISYPVADFQSPAFLGADMQDVSTANDRIYQGLVTTPGLGEDNTAVQVLTEAGENSIAITYGVRAGGSQVNSSHGVFFDFSTPPDIVQNPDDFVPEPSNVAAIAGLLALLALRRRS